jgi:hypothetical protein
MNIFKILIDTMTSDEFFFDHLNKIDNDRQKSKVPSKKCVLDTNNNQINETNVINSRVPKQGYTYNNNNFILN